jgi:hypothetical protein
MQIKLCALQTEREHLKTFNKKAKRGQIKISDDSYKN